jgi:hypothetical protein
MHGGFGRCGVDYTGHDNDVGAQVVHAAHNHRSGDNRHHRDGSTQHLIPVDKCAAADSCVRARTRCLSGPERVPAA